MYVLHVQTPITFCLNRHFSTRVSALSVTSCFAHAGLYPPVHAHIQPPAHTALPAGRRRGRAGPRRVPMVTAWRLAPGGGAALAGCRRPRRAGEAGESGNLGGVRGGGSAAGSGVPLQSGQGVEAAGPGGWWAADGPPPRPGRLCGGEGGDPQPLEEKR